MTFKQAGILSITLLMFSFSIKQDKTTSSSEEIVLKRLVKNTNEASKKWTNLLNENHADYWEVFMGVPHGTVTGLDHIDSNSDGKKGTPLGLNNDPKKVFTIQKIANEIVLHISGEIYGALTSKQEYENYHLKLQFKWGEKKWEPRLRRERDSGILYHCVGEHGAFWNVWMQSQEFQVQQGDMGDYYALAKTAIDIPSSKKEGEGEFNYIKGGDMNHFSSANRDFQVHCNKGLDNEKLHGEWNTLELISVGSTSLHIVNGKVVMALYNSEFLDGKDTMSPLTKGKLQIQSEAAEAFYKNIQIRSITELPEKFKKQL